MKYFSLSIKRKFYWLATLIILFSIFHVSLFAQENKSEQKNSQQDLSIKTNYLSEPKHKKIKIYFGSGISVPIKGERYWNADWSADYLFSGSVFYAVNHKIFFGLRLSYNHWIPDEDYITGNFSDMTVTETPNSQIDNIAEEKAKFNDAEWASTSGNANLIEIMPSIRYIIVNEYGKTNLYFQAGVGLINYSGNFNYSGYYLFWNPDHSILLKEYDYSNIKKYSYSKPAINLGIGVKAGFVEVFPCYNIIFTHEKITQYININIGFSF